MNIEIDPKAGFCFGVTRVVNKAEEIIKKEHVLYCLGEIVHNQKEIQRLEGIGLKTITHEEFFALSDCHVLIRAHGEPPETYKYAKEHNIELIDGTCPIVLRLQSKVKQDYNNDSSAQIVIYGKKDHAEVIGLAGQTNHQAIIVESEDDLEKIDFDRPLYVYAQTTMSTDKYRQLQETIIQKAGQKGKNIKNIRCTNSICRQVSGRIPQLKAFAEFHDVVLFVSYKQSSNGKLLFSQCREVNDKTYFVSELSDVDLNWFNGVKSIGITGATSTPRWLLEEFASFLQQKIKPE